MVTGPALRASLTALEEVKSAPVRRQHFLPVRGLSARRSHAVRSLQHFPFDPAARGALAAARAGPRGRSDRAHAGSAGRPARRAADDRQRRGRLIAGPRPDLGSARRDPSPTGPGSSGMPANAIDRLEEHFAAIIGESGRGGRGQQSRCDLVGWTVGFRRSSSMTAWPPGAAAAQCPPQFDQADRRSSHRSVVGLARAPVPSTFLMS